MQDLRIDDIDQSGIRFVEAIGVLNGRHLGSAMSSVKFERALVELFQARDRFAAEPQLV